MESELYLLFLLLTFQVKVLLPVGGVVKFTLHPLWLSRGPPFPGLSTEPPSHYRENFINAKKKKKKVKCDLAGIGVYPKELCFGLYSLPKESEQISRLQRETKQSCSVPVEMRCRTGECKQMWRHFDAFLKRQMTFVLLYFRFCSSPLIENMMQKAIVTSFSFLNLSGEQKAQSSSR